MEITNDIEVRLVVTARKIRQFNERIAQLNQLGAATNIAELERMRNELEREFQWLSVQIRTSQVAV